MLPFYSLQTNTPALWASVSSSEKWDYSNLPLDETFVRVMEVGREEELGRSRHFLLMCQQFSHSSVGENSHLLVHWASPGRTGCDNLQLLVRHLVTQISVAWRFPA